MSLRRIAVVMVAVWAMSLAAVVVVGLSLPGSERARDVLRLTYADDPDTLNPVTASDTVSEAFQREVYEALADRDYADPDKWIPVLATRWQFDREKLTYTIELRRGVKWHPMRLPSGKLLPETELTARDVKFTFDCILNPHVEATSLRSYYMDEHPEDPAWPYKIKVEVVDPHTVKVRWLKPYFLAKEFTLGIPIIPRHVYSVDEYGEPISFDFSLKEFADGFNNHWANTKMCGTGPLMYKEWTRSRQMVLIRNPDYWGKPFHFQRVVYAFIANANTATKKLLNNELDFASIQRKDQYLEAKTAQPVVEGKVELADFPYPGYRYIGYNLKSPFLGEQKVRWALSHAVPVQRIIDQVWKGLAVPISGPFLPGSTASDDSIRPVPFDLERARALLEEAGWTDSDQDGIRDKMVGNQKVSAEFELMIFTDAPQYSTLAEIIKENCRKIGVRVSIAPTKWALMLQKLRKKTFDATMLGWALSWEGDPFQIWHGSQADLPDSSNSISYRNLEVDKRIDELRVSVGDTPEMERRRAQLYREIHRLIYEDQPYTFLFQEKATAGYDARLRNVRFYKIRPCYDTREWYAADVHGEKTPAGKGTEGGAESAAPAQSEPAANGP